MRKLGRMSLVAVTLFALAGSAGAQQVTSQNAAPEVRQTAPVLATESSARVGISRAKSEAALVAAEQPSDNTVKWAIIIGVAVVAALLIVALAD